VQLQLCFDPTSDRLELTLDLAPEAVPASAPGDRVLVEAVPCILDVADEGRLLGIELPTSALPPRLQPLARDDLYIEIEAGATPRVVRSVTVPATISWQPAAGRLVVSIPRRTEHYELLFPSGAT